MAREPMIVRSEELERPLEVMGATISILAANETTGGMGFTLQQGPEGTGPPPHCHPWDEAFFVLHGTIAFEVDGKASLVGAGTLVHVPGGATHAFRYGPGGGKMLEVTGPGSCAARMFSDLDAELAPGALDIAKAVEIFGRHQVRLMM